MLDRLLSLIAPHECLVCSREGSLLCGDCANTLPAIPERCYKCLRLNPENLTCEACRRTSPLGVVQSATTYSGPAKDIIWQLKFAHARAAAAPMSGLMTGRFVFDRALLVPVPTATGRVRQRGYDQAAVLARELSLHTGLPRSSILARHGQTRQVGMSRRARKAQLVAAFRVRRPSLVLNKHIILVDDVLTTGATLEAAAMVLRRAGAKRVDAVVFAQA